MLLLVLNAVCMCVCMRVHPCAIIIWRFCVPLPVPASSPRNVTVSSGTSTSLFVRWEPPSLEDQNGVIVAYILTYTNNSAQPLGDRPSMMALGTNRTFRIVGLDIFTEYNVTVAAATAIGRGPYSTTTTRTLNDSMCRLKSA